eukprot:scaffold4303_cov152-Isochrysis_galbana.AAC.1
MEGPGSLVAGTRRGVRGARRVILTARRADCIGGGRRPVPTTDHVLLACVMTDLALARLRIL